MQCLASRIFHLGELAEALRRNIVQPIVVGTGTKIKETSVEEGTNLAPNQQVLLYRIGRRNSRHVWLGKRDCRDLC